MNVSLRVRSHPHYLAHIVYCSRVFEQQSAIGGHEGVEIGHLARTIKKGMVVSIGTNGRLSNNIAAGTSGAAATQGLGSIYNWTPERYMA